MYKERLVQNIKNLQNKIERDSARGFNTDNKKKALQELVKKAEQKGIKAYRHIK